MLRIILADDEFLVRMAFINTINWEEHGFKLIGAASNGLEAWEMIQKERPDIVITDLTMPKMGGLELIEKVKQAGVSCEFVVLSCHNEFEYVKQALKLGVFDYILKLSMDMTELMDIMNRLKDKIEIYRQRKNSEILHRNRIGEYKSSEMSDLDFQVIIADNESSNEEEREKNQEKILYVMGQITEGIVQKEVFIAHERPVLLLWNPSGDLAPLLRDIQREVQKYVGIHLSIGIGSLVHGNMGIKQSFDEALIAYNHRFYRGEDSITFYEKLSYQKTEMLSFQIVFPELLEILESNVGVEKLRNGILNQIEILHDQENIEPAQMRMFFHELLTRIKLKLEKSISMTMLEQLYMDVYQHINCLEYMEDIQQDFIYFLDVVLEQMKLIDEHEIVKIVKRYVKKNLSGDLQVREVSKTLGVNPDYMSHLFVTETGMRYTDYVNRIRMERVCELLKTTNDKIYEIAEKCGFENSNYLIRVFRRYMGMTPLDWRKIEKEKSKKFSNS